MAVVDVKELLKLLSGFSRGADPRIAVKKGR